MTYQSANSMNTKMQKKQEANCQTLVSGKEKRCEHCLDTFYSKAHNAKFCSTDCWSKERAQEKNSGVEGIDFIKCPVCDKHVKQITQKHAQMHNFVDAKDMMQKLNMQAITCQSQKDKVGGENNPGYQHGGKFSKFSKNFVNGYDKEWHDIHKENHSTFMKEHASEFSPFVYEYWLNLCSGDKAEADTKYREYQARDLSWFVGKHGDIEGKKKHAEKIEKWMKSYKKQNFSKISQELFDEIIKNIDIDNEQIYYATFDREDMKDYINKEYILKTDTRYIRPDFIILDKKKIIEFDGEYWHNKEQNDRKRSNPNKSRDEERDEKIAIAGFTVLHIKEVEYKNNKQKVIQECIDFLTK